MRYEVEVAPCSRLGGKHAAVYASCDIPKDQYVMPYIGEYLSKEEFYEIRVPFYNRHSFFYGFECGSSTVVDATLEGNVSRLVNHACGKEANLESINIPCGVESSGAAPFVALYSTRAIEAGEELRYDYFVGDKKEWQQEKNKLPFVCKCGAKHCISEAKTLQRRR